MIDDEFEPYPGYWDDVFAAEAEPPTVPDAVDAVSEVGVLIAVHQAEQYERVAALRRAMLADAGALGCAHELVDRSLRLELACALRVTEYAAGDLIARATALVDRYPRALASLAGARITDQHARFLVDVLAAVNAELADAVLDRALGLAETLPAGTFRRALRRLVEVEQAVTLGERHEQAVARRRVTMRPIEDGMAEIVAILPAVEAHAIFDRLTRIGKTLAGRHGDPADPRTLDQARADVLGDLLIDGACESHPPAARGIRASVVVTVPVLSLLDDTHAATAPATVEGVGPIPVGRARELCGGSGKWMRVLTHPETGMVLSVGRTRYDPPPELRRLVRWRADRCMAPGCGMPASRCDIDHNIAWADGGHTALANHEPFCEGHHVVKHHGGWSIRQLDGGAVEWTSPYGRRYTVEPERRLPVFTPDSAVESGEPPF